MATAFARVYCEDIEKEHYSDYATTVKPDIDLSHHLSQLSKRRPASTLKSLFKWLDDPEMISFAGGMPPPEYFPFDSISADALVPESLGGPSPASHTQDTFGPMSWLWGWLFASTKHMPRTRPFTIPKFSPDPKSPTAIQLSTSLQYGTAQGHPALVEFITHFTRKVYQPLNTDSAVLLHVGNTDGWVKVVQTFCEFGDYLLTEDWAYTSALSAAAPYGVKPVGVAMDGQGLRADALEEVLEHWNPARRGGPRLPVLYTVPVGQNPCGTTMGAKRKKAIYEVCVKYDVIIVEDDPYFFLQVGEYVAPSFRPDSSSSAISGDDELRFIDSLEPSFLRFDYQGRVIRMDTFSKTIAPGCRLGWFTTNSLFAERLERQSETTTQAPSGFVQASQLLVHQWKYPGYIRWLQGIRVAYTQRRDTIIDVLGEIFDLKEEETDDTKGRILPLSGDVKVFVARNRSQSVNEKKGNILFSFVVPTAGMFLWLKLHMYNHKSYSPTAPPPKTPDDALEAQFWTELAEDHVLFAPGWIFGTDDDARLISAEAVSPDTGALIQVGMGEKYWTTMSEHGKYGHLRMSYSMATVEELRLGITRFANVLRKRFYL
ncbi:pyridoxal phosphate-dependent transferase [Cantharellus anzutake]|uniref:pyridoxal phosphate-dependent transferase n=1 Tax=Cantharellus anzutake TaxID=1750568 RepID=UPI001905BAD9|nr:pyridoxal phosphate-dependent transferase [Cantharellus anzutake]KAF8314571.1 pyridoxal phosphate-dependent transferase [Cantharellus anzutake]